jgi:hypothetical protein
MVHVRGRRVVVVPVYIPNLCARRTKEENLEVLSSRLERISGLVERE